MKEKHDILRWFSGLDVATCQATAKDLSKFLASFGWVKSRIGNQCQYKPCGRHQYARGVCNRHYSLLKSLAKNKAVGWNSLVDLGLCRRSLKNHDGNGKIRNLKKDVQRDDPLLSLVR